jgi:hypothetical protein
MIFLAWLFFSFVIIILAAKLGRNGFAWFIISLIISPLFAGILLLIYGKTTKAKAMEIVKMRAIVAALEEKGL